MNAGATQEPLEEGHAKDPRDLTAREIFIAILASIAVAVAMSWPLATHLGDSVPYDLGDPLLTTWDTAWLGHAMKTNPTKIFQANIFNPEPDTTAYTDALYGLAPFSVIGNGRTAALVRHGIFWIGAYAVALLGAFLLAREIGARWPAATVAALAFAYAPFRLGHGGHLHVLWSGGIPITFFLLVRGFRRRRWGLTIAGWIVAAWQLSLGWNIGLPFAYFLLAAAGITAILVFARRLPSPGRIVVLATVAGAIFFAGFGFFLSRPYQRVVDAQPHARRPIGTVEYFSPPISGLLAAPTESRVWGSIAKPYRAKLKAPVEESLFPGIVIVALAGFGLFYGAWPRWVRFSLFGVAAVFTVLALGVHSHGLGRWYPYRLLYNYAPGFQALRTPGRLTTFTALALGLLGAMGVDVVTGRKKARVLFLAALVAAEGLGAPIPTARVPEAPRGIEQTGTALQLWLPIRLGQPSEALFMFWATDHFPPLVNGYSGLYPSRLANLSPYLEAFPDARSVQAFRDYGIRTVVADRRLLFRTRWADVATRSIDGLSLSRRAAGDLVIFTL
ncbi:MAG: hypothetical protein ABR548_03170 [Actinomycetota bacterium]|nr:hypothetical protein [Actinomycetota bacterium]